MASIEESIKHRCATCAKWHDFEGTQNVLFLMVFWCSNSIKTKWKAILSFGAPQHWCCQAWIRLVWLLSKEHAICSLRPPLTTPPKTTVSTLRQHNFWTTQPFATKRAHFINDFYYWTSHEQQSLDHLHCGATRPSGQSLCVLKKIPATSLWGVGLLAALRFT